MGTWTGKIKTAAIYLMAAFLFLSAYGKISDLEKFFSEFASYRIAPPFFQEKAAWLIIGSEILLALGMLIKFTQKWALRGVSVLMFVFAVAIGFVVMEGREISCGCSIPLFGESTVSWGLVGRNIALSFLTLILSISPEPGKNFAATAIRWLGAKSWAIIAIGLIVVSSLSAFRMTFMVGELFKELRICQREHPGLRTGQPVGPLTIEKLGGGTEEVDFSASPGGTMLLFFSATCSHCKHIAPWWQELYKKYGNQRRFISIAKGTNAQIKQFITETGATFPMYRLGGGRTISDYRVYGYPRTILVDNKGRTEAYLKGSIPDAAKKSFEDAFMNARAPLLAPDDAPTPPPPADPADAHLGHAHE